MGGGINGAKHELKNACQKGTNTRARDSCVNYKAINDIPPSTLAFVFMANKEMIYFWDEFFITSQQSLYCLAAHIDWIALPGRKCSLSGSQIGIGNFWVMPEYG